MKKMIVVLFLFFILVSNIGEKKDFTLKDYVDGDYFAYTTEKVNADSIFLGTCFMTEDIVGAKNTIGESVKTNNTELTTFLNDLNADIVSTEYLECGAVIIYAFSPKIKDKVKIKDKNVNLQIASYTDYSVIGWPLILGSF